MTDQYKILIVDDEPRNLMILEATFSHHPNIKKALNGQEAVQIAKSFLPDLILLDIHMPQMDGYAACRLLKAIPQLASTRIIVISGSSADEDRLKGYEAGADDFVSKPFHPEELRAKARAQLSRIEAERKLQEATVQQMLQIEKAAFIGNHIAQIVHNLNNPLAILMGNMEVLEMHMPDNKRIKSCSKATHRLHEIVKSILQTCRQNHDQSLQSIDLNQILKNELRLLEAETFFKYQVKLTTDFAELPPLQGSPNHFCQSFGNLIKNAVESMHDRERKELRVRTFFENGTTIVEISDTGCGICPTQLHQLFTPFYSTKPLIAKGNEPTGTGLGLASVKNMIEAHGGQISVESKINEGTVFRVIFPPKSDSAFRYPQAA